MGRTRNQPTMIQALKRSKRWSILPAFIIDGFIAWEVHHGSITSDILNEFVRLAYCAGGNGSRLVLIKDNASKHWSEELRIMCQDANVLLVHLPPYSPDFNPIETRLHSLF